MGDPLAGCAGKVERARTHLRSLHGEVSAFLDSQPKPYTFGTKVDVEASRYLMIVQINRALPMDWSLVVGDALHNLRAALDHLVWQLVRSNGQRPSGANAFPILDNRPGKKGGGREAWNRNITGLHPAAIDFIERCQPYNGPDGPTKHTLNGLRRLSNEDKHRIVLPSYAAVMATDEPTVNLIAVRDVESIESYELHTEKPLENGDRVLSAAVTITGPNPEVKAEGALTLDVAFGSALAPLKGLFKMGESVEAIVSMARASFFGASTENDQV